MRFCPGCGKETSILDKVTVTSPDSHPLSGELAILLCEQCHFYFTDAGNVQEDYDSYYLQYNNYGNMITSADKDQHTSEFLLQHLPTTVERFLDYGCGNKLLSQCLASQRPVTTDNYDLSMPPPLPNFYDCITVCHVLEHIYDIAAFLTKVTTHLLPSGYLFIEVPNAEFYDKFEAFGPLQEINLEHINFFSKHALSRVMSRNGFLPRKIEDGSFTLNGIPYFVIRGLFQLPAHNGAFLSYLVNGKKKLEEAVAHVTDRQLYIYGCGQFLFKVFRKLQEKNTILAVVDDNESLHGLTMGNGSVPIIPYHTFRSRVREDDAVFVATYNYSERLREKLALCPQKIHILFPH